MGILEVGSCKLPKLAKIPGQDHKASKPIIIDSD